MLVDITLIISQVLALCCSSSVPLITEAGFEAFGMRASPTFTLSPALIISSSQQHCGRKRYVTTAS